MLFIAAAKTYLCPFYDVWLELFYFILSLIFYFVHVEIDHAVYPPVFSVIIRYRTISYSYFNCFKVFYFVVYSIVILQIFNSLALVTSMFNTIIYFSTFPNDMLAVIMMMGMMAYVVTVD